MEVFVHYRVGSLEKQADELRARHGVHYRVGSLEMLKTSKWQLYSVHYLVGMTKVLTIIYQSEFAIIT